MDIEQFGLLLATILGWSVGGMAALLGAQFVYEALTPFNAKKELVEDQNAAVGVSKGLFMVAAGILLHGIIVGDKLAENWAVELGLMVGLYVVGLALLWLGRLVTVKLSPFDFNDEIHIKDNLAVGIIEGCTYVAFAIIIHSAL